MISIRALAVAVALAVPALAAGCGVHDPVNDPPPAGAAASTPEPLASASAEPGGRTTGQTPPDAAYPGPADVQPIPGAAVPGEPGARAAAETVERFAARYINWDWDTLGASRRELVDMAAGPLRDQLLQTATELLVESERRPSGQSNSGRVEGILIEAGKPIYVLTHETAKFAPSTPGQELYSVYVAQVQEVDGAWLLTEWRAVTS